MDAPAATPRRPSAGLDAGWAETTDRLRAFIARRVDTPQLADDLTQDVLTRSLASGLLDTVDNPTGWLYRAARNAVIDHYRLRRRHQPLDDDDDAGPNLSRTTAAPMTPPASSLAASNPSSNNSPPCTATRSSASTSTARPTIRPPPPPASQSPA